MKKAAFILLLLNALFCAGQSDSIRPQQKDTAKPFNRKEEIVYDGKRYRKYNNYLTIGGGPMYSSLRSSDQKNIGADFTFHVKAQYMQLGAFMSGDNFTNNKNTEAHICYGLRYERNRLNLAAFIGPGFSIYVVEQRDSTGEIVNLPVYTALGGYICVQAVYKFKYDVGIGGEIFSDLSPQQQVVGARIVIYFSGAYRGIKRGFNTKNTNSRKK